MRRSKTRALVLASFAWIGVGIGLVLAHGADATPVFMGLGDLSTSGNGPSVGGISADGAVVVGQVQVGSTRQAFRWTEATGMTTMADVPGGTLLSSAAAASADGNTIVGSGSSTASNTEASVWPGGGTPLTLGDLQTARVNSRAVDVSADGSVVVGIGSVRPPPGNVSQQRAFRWTAAGGMQNLGTLPTTSPAPHSVAAAVSGDGSLVVGGSSAIGNDGAFLWRASTGTLSELPDLYLDENTAATGISSDGRWVVGQAGLTPVVWDLVGGGVSALVNNAVTQRGLPNDVSAHGEAIVGQGPTGAYLWTQTASGLDIAAWLQARGVDLTGWTLTTAIAVSDDGLTIVGDGINPAGRAEPWLVRLDFLPVPEPGTALLLGLGLVLAAAAKR
jgi:uncharacterized membrane protein